MLSKAISGDNANCFKSAKKKLSITWNHLFMHFDNMPASGHFHFMHLNTLPAVDTVFDEAAWPVVHAAWIGIVIFGDFFRDYLGFSITYSWRINAGVGM